MVPVAIALAKVKKTAIVVVGDDDRKQLQSWSDLQTDIIRHDQALLPTFTDLEEDARNIVQKDLNEAVAKQLWLTNRIKYSRWYHNLSLDPLGWRNKDGWPELVVFTFNSSTISFIASSRGSSILPPLPQVLADTYEDVLTRLTEDATKRGMQLRLILKFSGVIPDEAKRRMEKARQRGLEKFFVIAEPIKIEVVVEPIPVPMYDDPLIVGLDNSGQLWLIADFDTTPVEEAMFLYEK
jgi:hypothetical protein